MTNQPKAYSYVRFSTPEQARGDSKRRQIERAKEYAAYRGLELVDDAFMDLGVSAYRGRNSEEGALAGFLLAVKDGVIERGSYLLVESMDRISRDRPRKAVRLLEDICETGIIVVTLADRKEYSIDTLDDDPMAFMYAFMVAIRANEESETKAKRIRAVWSQKRKNATDSNAKMTSRCPAWLRLSDDRTEFEPIKERVAIVKRIFREADNGTGQHAIAQMLNKDGVDTFGDGSRKAKYWHRSYIAKILKNPAVTGMLVPHVNREGTGRRTRDAQEPIVGYYPRIVPKTQFERVEARRTGGAVKMRARDGKVSNVLAGLAKCPKCGGSMSRVNKGRRNSKPYLVCNAAKAKADCDYKQVKLELIETALIHHATKDIVFDVPSADETLNEKAESYQSTLMGYDTMIEEIVTEIARGNASDALRKRLTELENSRADADAGLQEVLSKMDASGGRALERTLETLESKLPNLREDPTSANMALRDAFNSCVVNYETGTLILNWRHSAIPTHISYDLGETL